MLKVTEKEKAIPLDCGKFPDGIGFFRSIQAHVMRELWGQSRTLANLPKGHVLFMQGDAADSFYVVKSGWVKLFRETLDGDEAVLDVLSGGHVFGETAIFEDFLYSYSVEVAEAATVLSFPLSVLDQAIREDGNMAMAMLKHLNGKNIVRDKEIEHRGIQNAPQRIGCYLLRLCKEGDAGSAVFHLPYDKNMIAARLGMKPETFSRALARLQKDIGLRVKGYTIEVDDLRALVHYTCGACSDIFPCGK